jgi:predicted metalloprotease
MNRFFTAEARKAQWAAIIGFFAPILIYLQAQGEWSWRAFAGAVVSGVISAAVVFNADNAPLGSVKPLRRLRDRHTQEGS